MDRRTVLFLLAVPVAGGMVRAAAPPQPVEVRVPLVFATLAGDTQKPQVGAAIVLSDLAEADKQISTVLLHGLQDLGLLIESPRLGLDDFLAEGKEWRSSRLELSPDWITGHNRFAAATPLPINRVYAVQYTGRYQYAPAMLRLVMAITLFERSALGPLRLATMPYSSTYFADRLERSIMARLSASKAKT